MVDGAQQQQEPTAPPVDAPESQTPPVTPAPSEDAAPSEGRQPAVPAYAAVRPVLSAQGRRSKAATDALGLDKDATPEEIGTAIEALKRPRGTDPEVQLPAEVVAEQNRLAQRAWKSAERDFGEDFALQAQGLQELVFNTDDPYELTAALHEMAQSVSQQPQGEQQQEPPAQQAAQAQPQQDRPGVEMEVGQPGWKVQADEDDKAGSGDTRGFFERVFTSR